MTFRKPIVDRAALGLRAQRFQMRPVIVRHLRPRVQSFVGLQSVEYLDAIMTGMDLELLRVQVYRTFAGTGRAPTVADLAESVQGSPAEVQEGLQQLARNRHVVLDAAGAIVMACLLYTSPSPRDRTRSRMPSSA